MPFGIEVFYYKWPKEISAGNIILFFKFIYLCVVGCAGSSLLHTDFLYLRLVGLLSSCVWASHCSGSSCCGAQALGSWASEAAAPRLWSTGSGAGAQAWLFSCMRDLPGPGVDPRLLHLHEGSSRTWRWPEASAPAWGIFPDQALTRGFCTGRQMLNLWTSRESQNIVYCGKLWGHPVDGLGGKKLTL